MVVVKRKGQMWCRCAQLMYTALGLGVYEMLEEQEGKEKCLGEGQRKG